MKALNTKAKRISLIALASIVIVTVCVVGRRPAWADDKADFLAFGVVSVSTGQTVRLHAVSVGVAQIQPIELMFYDHQGNMLAQSSERLLPGSSASLNFMPVGEFFHRMGVYAVLRFVNGSPKRGYVIPSLEVIDNSSDKAIFMNSNLRSKPAQRSVT